MLPELFTFTIPMNCEAVIVFKSTIYASIIGKNNSPFRMAVRIETMCICFG